MDDYLQRLRHTASHILAMAVLRLWPDTKLGIGPTIENGFYYDFLFTQSIKAEDLQRIEAVMQEIIDLDLPVKQVYKSREEAVKFYTKWDQPFKRELLEGIEGDRISFYVIGDESSGFVDLCKGPHVKRTGEVQAFKLLSIAGAYWRGDEKRPMLTRIYGTAFLNEADLKNFVKQLEDAKQRDHRRINKRRQFYLIDPKVIGSGLPIFLPRGAYAREKLEQWIVDLYKKTGHMRVYTPHLARQELWYTSGHLPYYKDSMYPAMKVNDDEVYYVKAMNCPLHIQVYKRLVKSYRELPFRVTDMASVYRYEKPGELHGLTRVRSLTQDDGHIFCTEDQILDEIVSLLNLAEKVYSTFGFSDIRVDISVRGGNKDKYLGDSSLWEKAEDMLIKAVQETNFQYETVPGEAAFYGPKIDFHVNDAVGRSWQLATIQLDFNLPERFDLSYTDKNGKQRRPVMIHRALFGSFQRFLGILIEHFKGDLPLWLEFEKVRVIPVTASHVKYATEVKAVLETEKIEAIIDDRDEPLGNRIKRAEEDRVPYIVIVGDKELSSGAVSVRVRNHGDIGLFAIDEFVAKLKEEIESKMIKSVFLK